MRWSDLLRMSVSSLRRRKLRTFLTVLGVVIGTASIVVMISLGLGMQEAMYEEVAQNGGTTAITVTRKETWDIEGTQGSGSSENERSGKYVTDETLEEVRTLEHVKSAYPVLNISAIAMKGQYEANLEITGMPLKGLEELHLDLKEGGNLPDPSAAQMQVVYGNTILMNFYDRGTNKGYWDTETLPDIDLENDPLFLVFDTDAFYEAQNPPDIGKGESSASQTATPKTVPKKYVVESSGILKGDITDYNRNSSSVYCDLDILRACLQKEFRGRVIPGQPSTAGGKPYGKFVYSMIKIQADDMKNVESLSNRIRELEYEVSTNIEYIDSMKKQFALVQAVLGGIGAISLLVAAIGIANTMMMSIYERTKEIGVMKVIGCGLKNIRQLFLIEAAFIGLVGGVAGNLLSMIVSAAMNVLASGGMGAPGKISYIPVWLVILSTGFAILVGTVAGYFPARRAMRLSPLEAIRAQ